MTGFTPRSAEWLVRRREPNSRGPHLHLADLFGGGFAFSDRKSRPKPRWKPSVSDYPAATIAGGVE